MSFPFAAAFRETIAAQCLAFPRQPHDDARLSRAAVALTLVEADDGSGQTARCDAGETAEEAAARELEEELGLRLPREHILGALDDYPTRSGYVITPVVAWLDDASLITPSPDEVASVHRIRLDHVARDDAVAFPTIPESPRPLVQVSIGDQFINAPTAAMIYQLRELIAGRVTRVAHFEQPVFAWR